MSSNTKELKEKTKLQAQTQARNNITKNNKSIGPNNIKKIKIETNNDLKIILPISIENE